MTTDNPSLTLVIGVFVFAAKHGEHTLSLFGFEGGHTNAPTLRKNEIVRRRGKQRTRMRGG